MVLGVVSSNGDIMPPHFFGDKETVNAEVYIRVLDEVVKPWIDSVTKGTPYVFQQDSAPAHAAKKTQEWCKANMSNEHGLDERLLASELTRSQSAGLSRVGRS